MMGRTHLVLGLDMLWLLEPVISSFPQHLPPALIAAMLGALLPDLDAPSSLLQTVSIGGVRPFQVPARAVAPYGHRGVLHSIVGFATVAVLATPLLAYEAWVWTALLLGYVSHLAADACTRSGIRLWYPDPRRFHLVPRPLRLTTGSAAEDAVFVVAVVLLLTLLLRQLTLGV